MKTILFFEKFVSRNITPIIHFNTVAATLGIPSTAIDYFIYDKEIAVTFIKQKPIDWKNMLHYGFSSY